MREHVCVFMYTLHLYDKSLLSIPYIAAFIRFRSLKILKIIKFVFLMMCGLAGDPLHGIKSY